MKTKRFFDMSQPYFVGMAYAPNIGPFTMKNKFNLDEHSLQVSEYNFFSHTGTHLDAPRHFFKKGKTIDQIPLNRLAGRCIVVEAYKKPFELITVDDVLDSGLEVKPGDFVFFNTGWGAKFESPEYADSASVSLELAEWLVGKKINVVGIDCNTVDVAHSQRKPDFNFPVHRMLLGHEILIIEHLNLMEVSGMELNVFCFAINIKGADGSPVRVVGESITD